jgi:hypothetical protein
MLLGEYGYDGNGGYEFTIHLLAFDWTASDGFLIYLMEAGLVFTAAI